MKIATDVIDHIRYAAVIDGKKIHALYARPDDDRPWSGDIYAAKILRYAPAQRAYFVDLGAKAEAFLPHKNAKEFSVGDIVAVKIERPATADKNIRCSFIDETDQSIGLIEEGTDIVLLAQNDFPNAQVVGDLQGYDAMIVALRDEKIQIQNGLEIVIEHTAAFTAVDINNADPDLKPLDANIKAMTEILNQLRLRNISGQIIIDCLRLHNAEQRVVLSDHLVGLIKNDPCRIDLYGFTKLGLFEMTRARQGLSLAELDGLVG